MAVDPWSTAIEGAGVVSNVLANRSANKAQKELARRQAQYAQMQNQTYQQVNPLYLQMVNQYAQQLGFGGAEGVNQIGQNHFSLGGGPSREQQFGLGGGYGTYQDQLRLQAGEEDINRQRTQQANQLRHGLRGVAPEIAGAALARNQSSADQQYGQFRRGLAINQGQERERQMAQLMALLGPGLQAGGQAANIFGQQAAQQGQMANQAAAGIAGGVSNWQQQRAMQAYLASQNPAAASGGFPGPTSPAPWSAGGIADSYAQPRQWWEDL